MERFIKQARQWGSKIYLYLIEKDLEGALIYNRERSFTESKDLVYGMSIIKLNWDKK
jgi:hypothetical protein